MSDQDLHDFETGYHRARYDRHHLQAMTGIRSRSLHYYVQRRLIPPAIGSGPAARYTYEHAVRLQVLHMLKERGLTLREIKVVLDGYTVRELHDLSNGRYLNGAIRIVRTGLRRPQSGWPPKNEPLARVVLQTGVELHVLPRFHARAVMRAEELLKRIDETIDVEPERRDALDELDYEPVPEAGNQEYESEA